MYDIQSFRSYRFISRTFQAAKIPNFKCKIHYENETSLLQMTPVCPFGW